MANPEPEYSHAEHLHRFACWTAARAVQRGWGGGTTAVITEALEATGFAAKLAEFSRSLPSSAEFDAWHAERVGELTEALVDRLAKPADNIYGRVAKIIAVYIKTVCVVKAPDSVISKVAHPPIDGILLREVKKSKSGIRYPPGLGVHWSTFDKEDYQRAVNYLREINGEKPFWEIEVFWKAADH